MLMTGDDIRKARDSNELVIKNFDERCIQPASYDMRLGEEAITSSRRQKVEPSRKRLIDNLSG